MTGKGSLDRDSSIREVRHMRGEGPQERASCDCFVGGDWSRLLVGIATLSTVRRTSLAHFSNHLQLSYTIKQTHF